MSVNGSNFGTMFVILDDFAKRQGPGLSADAIAAKLRKGAGRRFPRRMVGVFPPPPVRGVGRTGGFTLMIEDRGDLGLTPPAQTDNLASQGTTADEPPGVNRTPAW